MKFWSQTAWLNEDPSFFNLGLTGPGLGLVTFHKTSPRTHHNYLQQNHCTLNIIVLVKKILGLVEMTSGLVNASFSLPEWQAVKMIFFAPWERVVPI